MCGPACVANGDSTDVEPSAAHHVVDPQNDDDLRPKSPGYPQPYTPHPKEGPNNAQSRLAEGYLGLVWGWDCMGGGSIGLYDIWNHAAGL